jgi:ABC-type multidrug transport system ATPase subunit
LLIAIAVVINALAWLTRRSGEKLAGRSCAGVHPIFQSIWSWGVTILDRITLQIEARPPTVLAGPNGSGETTLLRTAMGLVSPTQGRITWAGVEESPPARRAIVLQCPAMPRRSVSGDLSYALSVARIPHRAERLKELLSIVGLANLGKRPARRLSSGEQQRLARALARDPGVLLLDEPRANLTGIDQDDRRYHPCYCRERYRGRHVHARSWRSAPDRRRGCLAGSKARTRSSS